MNHFGFLSGIESNPYDNIARVGAYFSSGCYCSSNVLKFGMRWFFSKLLNYMFPSFFKIRTKVIRWHVLWGVFLFPLIILELFISIVLVYGIVGGIAYLIFRDTSVLDNDIYWISIVYIMTGALTLILFWISVGFIVRRPKLFKAILGITVPLYTVGIVWSFFADPHAEISSEPLLFRSFLNVAMTIAPTCLGYWLYTMVIHDDKDFDVAAGTYDLALRLHAEKKYFLAFSYFENLAFKNWHRLSLDFLGNAYENGLGKEENRGHAYACYESAFDLGHEDSGIALEGLADNLSPQEIEDYKSFKEKFLSR